MQTPHPPLQAWPVEAFGRLTTVHNNVNQFGTLHGSHGADLCLLGIKRNAILGLPVCGNAHVAYR